MQRKTNPLVLAEGTLGVAQMIIGAILGGVLAILVFIVVVDKLFPPVPAADTSVPAVQLVSAQATENRT